jgi:hypothetical protein
VLHPNAAHVYGALDVEGFCGIVSSHASGTRLSDLPVHRIHIQVKTPHSNVSAPPC